MLFTVGIHAYLDQKNWQLFTCSMIRGLIRYKTIRHFWMYAFVTAMASLPPSLAHCQDDAVDTKQIVSELKRLLPKSMIDQLVRTHKSNLFKFHLTLGMQIRNHWKLWDKNSTIAEQFKSQGISHPEAMSSIVIEALWNDLDASTPKQNRLDIERARTNDLGKQESISKIRNECSEQVAQKRADIDACYVDSGLKSDKLAEQPLFEFLKVLPSGAIASIQHSSKNSQELNNCLDAIINKFVFSKFEFLSSMTLYHIEMRLPLGVGDHIKIRDKCNVKEQF